MADAKKLNMILAILAIAILVGSFGALAYSFIPQGDSDFVTVNGTDYAWADIFEEWDAVSFTANDADYEGIPLAALVLDSGLQNPEAWTYRLTGIDGYQKDVAWNDIQNGYLTLEEHRAVFPSLTQSAWVRDLASIEVV